MQLFRLMILILVCAHSLLSGSEWLTDYEQVRMLSKKENKPMLLFFNGSDWAGEAMKMKHEMLDAPIFQETIGPCFICMEVDFPQHTSLSQTLTNQNLELKSRFKIQEPPLLLLLDANERVIAQVAYLPENAEQLVRDLARIVELDAQLCKGLENLESTSGQLRKIYQIAQELGNSAAIEKILDAGINMEDPFFFLERYRLLVEKGGTKSEEALNLRKKLLALGPEKEPINGQCIPFTLALIDFQELSQKNCDPEIATQPLIEYLTYFGNSDRKNVWRIEMMIAEVYSDADKWEEALKHAERAYHAAPESMHAEIAHSLDYIRSAQSHSR